MVPSRRFPGSRIWTLAGQAAAATPPTRDRVVDLLRGASLAVVVAGHVLMAVVTWDGQRPRVGNLLAELPALQPLTWLLQVMPVFFAAGAVANRASWRAASARETPFAGWLWGRLARLVRPVVFYLALWIPLSLLLEAALGDQAAPLATLSSQLLWFLGVYVVVVATTGWQLRLAARGPTAAVALLVAVGLVDLARFHLAEPVGFVNFVLVWVLTATVGLVVRDRLHRRRLLAATAAVALAANAALVAWGPYPLSMVGMPGEKVSNMAPPTLALALHAVALLCLVGLAWPVLERLCARPRVWHAACATGAVAMTLYLWHLTAVIAVTLAEHQLGWDRPPVTDGWFWPATVAHLALCLAAVLAVVVAAAPLEHLPVPWLETRSPAWRVGRWAAPVGVAAVALGLLAFAATGMAGFPFGEVTRYAGVPLTPGLACLVTAVGVLAVRAAGAPRAPAV